MIVEYLVVINRADAFCEDVPSFNRLLQVNSAILIKKGDIRYTNDFSCGYQITGGEVADRDQLYFHLKFTKDFAEEPTGEDVQQFLQFLKTIREVISKAGGQATTLWDDISYHFSHKSYPIIYEIENLMRKLIANFMLVTVGKEWASETSPSEIKEAFNKNKRNDYLNVLHSVDFIDLADFLLKPYSNKTSQELYTRLQTAKTTDDLNELKEFVPASNWKRYFVSLVNCEDGYLQKRWTDLYNLRCKVAHNAIVSQQDYLDIVRLADELRPKLTDALSKLPQVNMPPEEREIVAENAAGNLSDFYGSFVMLWRVVERHMDDLVYEQGLETEERSPAQALDLLHVHGAISAKHHNRLHWLRQLRNRIVHGAGEEIPEDVVREHIAEIQAIIKELGVTHTAAVAAVCKMLKTMYPAAELSTQRDKPNIFFSRGEEVVAVGVGAIAVFDTQVLKGVLYSLSLGQGLVTQGNVDNYVHVAVFNDGQSAVGAARTLTDMKIPDLSRVWVGYLENGNFISVTNIPNRYLLFKEPDQPKPS